MQEQHIESTDVGLFRGEKIGPLPPQRGRDADDVVVETTSENTRRLLTIHQVAREAGVTRAAVLRWIRNGYLQARTSNEGWLICADDIEMAREAADVARLGFREDIADTENVPTEIPDAKSVGERTTAIVSETRNPGSMLEPLSETFFAPLAEFVRDQSDVVQEQAETIGWLQAELRRARHQITEYETIAIPNVDPEPENEDQNANGETDGHESDGSEDTLLLFTTVDSGEIDELFATIHEEPVTLNDHDSDELQIDHDPWDTSSEEVACSRTTIEETERKILNLWREHEEQISKFSRREESAEDSKSWLSRLISPLTRRTAE